MSKRTLTVEDFPYDPGVVPEMVDGLDKLRAVEDRDYARVLFDLYWTVEANEQDPEHQRRWREDAQHKREQELATLRATTESALKGVFGDDAQKLAQDMLVNPGFSGPAQREDLESLRACVAAIRKIPAERRERTTTERRKGRSE